MVLYDPQEAGGLEEYATSLAVGLRDLGHDVCVVSATWIPPDNQYLVRLRRHEIPWVQPPRWLSVPGSHWPTKERILDGALVLLAPIVVVLGALRALVKREGWRQSRLSAQNWLRAQLTWHVVGPDRRPLLGRLALAWWRLRWRPDVLHVQGYTSTLRFAVEWAHAKGIPLVYEEHQTPDPQFDWWKDFGAFINLADVVIAVSEESKRALRTVCAVTGPIVARPPLLADPMADGWRRPGRRPGDRTIRVTIIARLYVTKGLEYLLEAIPLVRAAHPATEFRVYGNGPQFHDLMTRAAALGLDGTGIFAGAFTSREQLSRIMGETDIFVMSSILEGQPVALIEAMAYQCPIVATTVGGIPELIHDGVNGLLCAPRDFEGLAQRIITLVEDGPLRERLAAAARRSYEASPFRPASVCALVASVYDDARRGPASASTP